MNTESTKKYTQPTFAYALGGIVAILGLVAVIGFAVLRIGSSQTTNPKTEAFDVSQSKLGIFIQGYNGEAERIVNAGPAVVKILIPNPNAFYREDGEYNKYVTLAKYYKAKYPNGKVLIRFYFDENGMRDFVPANDSADDDADEVFELYKPILTKMRDKGDLKYFDYIAGPTNETERTPYWSVGSAEVQNANVSWLSRFWETLLKKNAAAGIKTCVGNILTGDIPITQQSANTIKAVLVPAMNNSGSVFCYHGYSDEGFSKTVASQQEQSLAYRQFYQKLGTNTPKMIIGELGIAGGWKVGTPSQYEDWLTWYDSEIKKDSQIIGATIYEVGANGPDQIDGPVASWLTQYLLTNGGGATATPANSSTPIPSITATQTLTPSVTATPTPNGSFCTGDSQCSSGKVCAEQKCVLPSEQSILCVTDTSGSGACERRLGGGNSSSNCSTVGQNCTRTCQKNYDCLIVSLTCQSGRCVQNPTAVNTCWGNPNGLGGKCYDCNGDDTINILDFTCFRNRWLQKI